MCDLCIRHDRFLGGRARRCALRSLGFCWWARRSARRVAKSSPRQTAMAQTARCRRDHGPHRKESFTYLYSTLKTSYSMSTRREVGAASASALAFEEGGSVKAMKLLYSIAKAASFHCHSLFLSPTCVASAAACVLALASPAPWP
eukprot:5716084-Pleurochrysis_carterae.AAC.2